MTGQAHDVHDPAGRIVLVLDLGGVTDKAGLMDRCVRDLALPDWFGRNWDALADSLADPTVWPEGAAAEGLLIVVRDWQRYAATRADEWEILREVFGEAAGRVPALTVTLAPGGSA
ncbi:barstar family protein [Streptomyces sp. NPDC056373]|uniref:barstar family protein n=1 Tax=Streptomyces sp. NPDC056373 TaxID=3345798 RepID=UPI0035D5DB55